MPAYTTSESLSSKAEFGSARAAAAFNHRELLRHATSRIPNQKKTATEVPEIFNIARASSQPTSERTRALNRDHRIAKQTEKNLKEKTTAVRIWPRLALLLPLQPAVTGACRVTAKENAIQRPRKETNKTERHAGPEDDGTRIHREPTGRALKGGDGLEREFRASRRKRRDLKAVVAGATPNVLLAPFLATTSAVVFFFCLLARLRVKSARRSGLKTASSNDTGAAAPTGLSLVGKVPRNKNTSLLPSKDSITDTPTMIAILSSKAVGSRQPPLLRALMASRDRQ